MTSNISDSSTYSSREPSPTPPSPSTRSPSSSSPSSRSANASPTTSTRSTSPSDSHGRTIKLPDQLVNETERRSVGIILKHIGRETDPNTPLVLHKISNTQYPVTKLLGPRIYKKKDVTDKINETANCMLIPNREIEEVFKNLKNDLN